MKESFLSYRMWVRVVVLFCLTQVFVLPIYAQSEFGGFENIGKKDGLFHLNTTSLFKDSKGFLWVGSTDGLMRFDGSFFDVFRKSRQDTMALSDNAITCITEDVDKNIFWIGTLWGGINRFDISNSSFDHFSIDSVPKTGPKRISSIHQISKDTLLVGTDLSGLYFFHPSSGKFEPTGYVKNKSRIYKIINGPKHIWVLSSKGVICLNKTNGDKKNTLLFSEINTLFNPNGSLYNRIRGFIEHQDGNVVFTLGNGLYKYNISTKKIELELLVDKSIVLKEIVEDSDGNYWIASIKDGLFFYDVKSKNVNNYRRKESDIDNSLVYDEIKDILFIKEQQVLFVATKRGLSKYDYHKSLFKQFDVTRLTDNRIEEVKIVLKDTEGTYWVSSRSGKLYKKGINQTKFELFQTTSLFYPYQAIQTDNENIWFVTNVGLYNFNLKTKKHKLRQFDCDIDKRLLINHIKVGLKAGENEMWLLSRYGLIHYNTVSDETIIYKKDFTKDKKGLLRFVSLDFSPDKKELWFVERSGTIYKFDIETNQYEKIDSKFLSGNTKLVVDVEIDKEGKLWIATFGTGVLIFDPVENTVSNELAIEELESYVYGIVSDDNDNMWISSNFGISRVNVNSLEVQLFDVDDGSIWGEFNTRTYYKCEDGTMLFGGQNGYIEFNSKNMYQNTYIEAPVISAWSKKRDTSSFFNDIYEEVTYINDTIISYEHGKVGDVKFYVSVLNYSHSINNSMLWKLEGHNSDWIESYSSVPIVFNNLSPGKYILRVKGVNNHGIESKTESRLRLIVVPAFYETLSFKVLIVLVLLAIMYIIVKVRITWYRDQKIILEDRVHEKTTEISLANKELENSKEEILKQNAELHIHRNNLEELVEIRTNDLKNAKLDAEESDRLKTAFLANLSHEIRTPMNAIIGFSSLIQLDEFEEDQKKEFIKLIGQSSESLLALIDDIIDISRIETGNVKILHQEIYLPELINETLVELSFEDKSDKVEFIQNCELKGEEKNILGDKYRLKQVLSNLIRNAFKFTKTGHVKLIVKSATLEELRIYGFSVNGHHENEITTILFVIEDTGIGIEESDMTVIFQPFQKATRNKELYKGMGLGLSIVKNLIVLFGGDIKVDSELGKGTSFSFYINASPVTNS